MRQIFWASSAFALILSLHCILNATFASVWGPGLALRGPTGSVSKAHRAMVREGSHINMAFVLSLFFLLVQSTMAFYILDWKKGFSPSSVVCTFILGGGAICSSIILRRMNLRFHFDTDTALTSATRADEQDEFVGTDDPDVLVARALQQQQQYHHPLQHPHHATHTMHTFQGKEQKVGHGSLTANLLGPPLLSSLPSQLPSSPFNHHGYLFKRGRYMKKWNKRYFRLEGATLCSWEKEVDYLMHTGNGKRFSLKGYQVLVREGQLKFCLEGMDTGIRTREFKCDDLKALKQWVGALCAASMVSQ